MSLEDTNRLLTEIRDILKDLQLTEAIPTFDAQELMTYQNGKRRKIGPKQYSKGDLSWGWRSVRV